MQHNLGWAILAGLGLALTPAMASAQNVSITRSVLTNLPYTLIYPAEMTASGGVDAPVTINHTSAPLQCELSVVPVEDTDWTAEAALDELDESEIATAWAGPLPGFSIVSKGTTEYQDATALAYEGTSTGSAMNIPLTLVHTEAVSSGRGYVLDCIFAADQAEQARPLVDFIIANFATRADADCCIGLNVTPEDEQSDLP
ncbi:hypothetical protein O9Z70_08920 [Devosia sp. YIM 151766]|uniref:hypothetical protein n=1 Tax=Devosia sp. YIM 151766 TaxID=3017325 RepID=UPI00255CB5DB|nr:hypothetical protein [Devosia sp. YIM 151766]WIY51611.1 hypothetical protein O9Z70_08920 [Devosia sp. YIM 151766]